jgi:hypothetical protein
LDKIELESLKRAAALADLRVQSALDRIQKALTPREEPCAECCDDDAPHVNGRDGDKVAAK